MCKCLILVTSGQIILKEHCFFNALPMFRRFHVPAPLPRESNSRNTVMISAIKKKQKVIIRRNKTSHLYNSVRRGANRTFRTERKPRIIWNTCCGPRSIDFQTWGQTWLDFRYSIRRNENREVSFHWGTRNNHLLSMDSIQSFHCFSIWVTDYSGCFVIYLLYKHKYYLPK